jgi:hypothetical protein
LFEPVLPPHPLIANVPEKIITSQSKRCTPRRRRRTRRDIVGSTTSIASSAREADRQGASDLGRTEDCTVCCVLIVSVIGVAADPTLKLAGVKRQEA